MRGHALGQFALHRFGDEMELLHAVVHAVWQGPAIQCHDRIVIWPGGRTGRHLRRRTVHDRSFGQAHVRGLAPGPGRDQRGPRGAGAQQLTSVHHVIGPFSDLRRHRRQVLHLCHRLRRCRRRRWRRSDQPGPDRTHALHLRPPAMRSAFVAHRSKARTCW